MQEALPHIAKTSLCKSSFPPHIALLNSPSYENEHVRPLIRPVGDVVGRRPAKLHSHLGRYGWRKADEVRSVRPHPRMGRRG